MPLRQGGGDVFPEALKILARQAKLKYPTIGGVDRPFYHTDDCRFRIAASHLNRYRLRRNEKRRHMVHSDYHLLIMQISMPGTPARRSI
jgi:hypothetical protein